MPTLLSPGGRTFAGGDMMPLVIPWPKAHAASTMTAATKPIFELKVLFILPTA